MISAIICSRNPSAFEHVRRNLLRTAGDIDLEVIRIDNSANKFGICEAYNDGVARAIGSILVFLHEDVYHLEFGWGIKLLQKFQSSPDIGVIGVAGSQIILGDPPLWSWIGRPYLFGKVVHELDRGERFFMTVFSPESGDREVAAVDGCWFSARKDVFQQVHFDAKTFPGFHFYDIDFCLQARKNWKVIATTDILVKHLSPGSFDESWQKASHAFRLKWSRDLPVAVKGIDVPRSRGADFFNVNLKGKLPQATLI